ncbi:LEAF RUST 10 DISEASE-RESISTANCE LOCUS RECEPTOR-LIKE PROTEIN KINASE-like 2.5 isoform X3 [Pistacia vera]|uniref:LEAF RUST 10 DISEASE-RESISTANCE LOCUS RECEPTOR-LIKE PROTEIN KINASE-like 2.5 isoform X3 n=1 Tax=Pistacia vera TaxID=55513 RepID=UPI001263D572|nr:LEAF RUST 10 DISEASE-RESISTANCE LOCUS RECEPTOR-LIKE PROTEIN KINASE-like 2.5 isoform X3 [Pistacia vera]
MDQNLSPLISCCIFTTFFFLARTALGTVQHNNEACVPKSCGDGLNISYPFYIHDKQESSCGHPEFQLSCNNQGNPILNINSTDYTIHQIFYTNQSFLLSNPLISATLNTSCINRLPRIQNLSFPDEYFELVPLQKETVLIYNCEYSKLPDNVNFFKVNSSCDGENSSLLAVYKNDANLGNALDKCNDVVVAPVDINEEDNLMGIQERLKRGFLLKWTVPNVTAGDLPEPGSSNGKGLIKKVAVAVVVTGIAILTIILVFCLIWRKSSWNMYMPLWKKKTKRSQDDIEFNLYPKRYSFAKVESSLSEELGTGAFGCVYKGNLDGVDVAVKVLNESKGNGEEFSNEVKSISSTSHVNIVNLIGYCSEENGKRALIYEFMPNGSLEKFIYGENPLMIDDKLKWKTLHKIAVGIAKGLCYLHSGCKTQILHFDIKPHNILLDEDFKPKISDFGLSRICPEKQSIIEMTNGRGTRGYIAPELTTPGQKIGGSQKSDVYSYGMMALEMVGGRKNLDIGADQISKIYFPDWVHKRLELEQELELQGIANDEDKEYARQMLIVGLKCIQSNPSDRPTMSEVVDMLEGKLGPLEIPPKP